MKLQSLLLFLYFALSNSYIFPIKTIGRAFPEHLKNVFEGYDDDTSQSYLGKDSLNRDITRIILPWGKKITYLWHTDASGITWKILQDEDNKKEIVFINIIGNSKTIGRYHPDTYEQLNLKELAQPERIIPMPDYFPCADDYTSIKAIPLVQDPKTKKQKPSPTTAKKKQAPPPMQPKIDPVEEHVDNEYAVIIDENPENDHKDCQDQDNLETPQKSPSPTWLDYCPSSTTLCIGSITALGIWLIYVGRQSWLGDAYLAKGLWSDWRSPEPYSVLLMVEPENLSEFLIEDITVTYFDDPDPIGRFLTDIQAEEDELIDWLHIRGVIERSFVIPTSSLWDTIEHRIELLRHMRKAVYYWRAQQIKTQKHDTGNLIKK